MGTKVAQETSVTPKGMVHGNMILQIQLGACQRAHVHQAFQCDAALVHQIRLSKMK